MGVSLRVLSALKTFNVLLVCFVHVQDEDFSLSYCVLFCCALLLSLGELFISFLMGNSGMVDIEQRGHGKG